MADKQLRVDDDYCNAMAQYYAKEGSAIEEYIQEYIDILVRIQKNAIMKGNVADSLEDYIIYAKKLKGKVSSISINAQKQTQQFLSAIEIADQYLF